MWIIGLLLLVAAVAVGIDIAAMNDQSVDLEAFNQVWTSSPAIVFLVGVVTALVGMFGLWLMISGLRRSRIRGRERRAEMAERDRLADERRRELAAMAAAGHDDESVSATDDVDREPVNGSQRETVDLRDDQETGHRTRHGLLHRSNR